MTKQKSGKGFFNKLFGQKGCCCSLEIEEVPQRGGDDAAEEKRKKSNIEVISDDGSGIDRG